jgi:hypothetical protein
MATIAMFMGSLSAVLLCGLGVAQTILRTLPLQGTFDRVVLLGDLDGDGVRDLAIAQHVPTSLTGIGAISVYSPRTGAALILIPAPTSWLTVNLFAVGDYDGDGRDDIGAYEWNFVASVLSARVVVRSGTTGSYLLQHPLPLGERPTRAIHANSDTISDFVLSLDGSPGAPTACGRVDVLDGATFQIIRTHIGTVANQGLGPYEVSIGDLDGDGVDDYLLGDSGPLAPFPRMIRVFSAQTGVQIAAFPRLSATYSEGICGIGDLNADGFDDLILGDRGNPPIYGGYAMHVLGGPGASQSPTLWTHVWLAQSPGPIQYVGSAARIGDLDGDGHDDLGLLGGAGVFTTLLAGRDQSVLMEFPSSTATLWRTIDSPGDVNGDGFGDLIFGQGLTSTTAVLHLVSGGPPGVQLFGAACVDQTGQQPRIGVGVGARLGKTMTINLSNANPSLLAATLAIGFDATTWGGSALPLDLTFLGMPGCEWYLAPDAVLSKPTIGMNGTRHHATHEISVPQVPGFLGLDLFSQWLVLEAGAAGLTGATTRAARITVVP